MYKTSNPSLEAFSINEYSMMIDYIFQEVLLSNTLVKIGHRCSILEYSSETYQTIMDNSRGKTGQES